MLVHLFAELVGESGFVVGLEHIEELRVLGQRNMESSHSGRAFLESGRVRFCIGDGRHGFRDNMEHEQEGGDAIHVGAGAIKLHEDLVQQLRCPGRMFIPWRILKGTGLQSSISGL